MFIKRKTTVIKANLKIIFFRDRLTSIKAILTGKYVQN